MELRCAVLFLILSASVVCELCPKQCDCDMHNGLNRATCVDQNIISVDVGVPKAVQLYVLSHNAISELDNFCFQEAGFSSVHVLDLSYNKIFWIGLHAFSGLDSLAHLDLSNNRLRYIPSDLFWDTPQLDVLDLSSNVFENLKNEPFLMHSQITVLNLNNCRIKSLPERLFTRLPNIRKLDLSENYMVTLNTQVLIPLRRLQRLELNNEYWQCNRNFLAVEAWIASKGITYAKKCRNLLPNMSEKIISTVSVERVELDVSQVWNVTGVVDKNETLPTQEQDRPLSPLQKFDKDFSALQSFVIGLEIGLAIGIVGTYIWLRKFCSCRRLSCTQAQNRRMRRRQRDGDMRANLLWSTVINPDLDTPPPFRRQHSLPERGPPYPTYGLPNTEAAAIRVDAIRLPDRSETPPPPYNECRINI